jgi:hypothetical protein
MVFSCMAANCGAPRESASPQPPPLPRPAPTVQAESKPQPKPRVARRSVVILSRKSGTSVTTFAPDGTLEFSYEHLENGRGPKLAGRGRLDADRRFTSFEARGKRTIADFLLIDGDPLADLTQLRKVTTVVRGGTVHESAELYRAVGVRP